MNFISISQFKEQNNIVSIDIITNPSTGKLFAQADNGDTFKVQSTIDIAKPITFMYDTAEGITEGCFINSKSNNVLVTL